VLSNLLLPWLNIMQARLNEIITSSSKTIPSNGSAEFSWMVDGAGLPPNASELLPKLVMFSLDIIKRCCLYSYHLTIYRMETCLV